MADEQVRIDKKIYTRIKEQAEKDNRSIKGTITELITLALDLKDLEG